MRKNLLAFPLYFAGILLGFSLATLAAWADFEANFYGFSRQTTNPFNGLRCPAFMARGESQTVLIHVANTASQPVKPNVKTFVSSPNAFVESLDFVELAPGESATLQKTVGAQNVDLERFIFVKAFVFSAYPMSDAEGACGIFVLPIPGNGTAFVAAAAALSLLFIAGGLYLLRRNEVPRNRLAPLFFLAALVVPALIFSLLGWWIQTGMLIVLFLMTLVIVLGHGVTQ